jgi:hypothetical protein
VVPGVAHIRDERQVLHLIAGRDLQPGLACAQSNRRFSFHSNSAQHWLRGIVTRSPATGRAGFLCSQLLNALCISGRGLTRAGMKDPRGCTAG